MTRRVCVPNFKSLADPSEILQRFESCRLSSEKLQKRRSRCRSRAQNPGISLTVFHDSNRCKSSEEWASALKFWTQALPIICYLMANLVASNFISQRVSTGLRQVVISNIDFSSFWRWTLWSWTVDKTSMEYVSGENWVHKTENCGSYTPKTTKQARFQTLGVTRRMKLSTRQDPEKKAELLLFLKVYFWSYVMIELWVLILTWKKVSFWRLL